MSTPGGCSVHWRNIIEYTGGVQYTGDIMSTLGSVGDTMSAAGEYPSPTFIMISPRCTHNIPPVH